MNKLGNPRKAKWYDSGEGYICTACWFRSVLRYKMCPKCGIKMKNGYVNKEQYDKKGVARN